MEINEEQFKELIDESAELGRANEEITALIFQELARSAPPAGTRTGREQRASARIGVRYIVTVRPILPLGSPAAKPFTAVIADVSRDGVGLVCPVPLQGKFALEMPSKDGVLFTVICSTRATRKLGDHRHLVGGSFDEFAEGFVPIATPASLKRSA